MICRNARCAAPREHRSERRTRAGNLDRRSRVRDAPLRRRYKVSAAWDAGNTVRCSTERYNWGMKSRHEFGGPSRDRATGSKVEKLERKEMPCGRARLHPL